MQTDLEQLFLFSHCLSDIINGSSKTDPDCHRFSYLRDYSRYRLEGVFTFPRLRLFFRCISFFFFPLALLLGWCFSGFGVVFLEQGEWKEEEWIKNYEEARNLIENNVSPPHYTSQCNTNPTQSNMVRRFYVCRDLWQIRSKPIF